MDGPTQTTTTVGDKLKNITIGFQPSDSSSSAERIMTMLGASACRAREFTDLERVMADLQTLAHNRLGAVDERQWRLDECIKVALSYLLRRTP